MIERLRLCAFLLVTILTAVANAGAPPAGDLPGMPPLLDRQDVYAGARPGRLSPNVQGFPDRIYVPNAVRNTVQVIDPHTFKVIDQFPVGRQPQHVVPSYDLKTLWVVSDLGDNLTRIDPSTGHADGTVKVKDPYNMYFTPDGKYAIVVAERVKRLDFRDAHTMALVASLWPKFLTANPRPMTSRKAMSPAVTWIPWNPVVM